MTRTQALTAIVFPLALAMAADDARNNEILRDILQDAARPSAAADQRKINPHSPGRYRTNGVVSNMPEFATAFSCRGSAPMVSQPVCRVW